MPPAAPTQLLLLPLQLRAPQSTGSAEQTPPWQPEELGGVKAEAGWPSREGLGRRVAGSEEEGRAPACPVEAPVDMVL